MKGLSFWQWLGLIIIISVIGGVIFRLLYGKQIIDALNKTTATDKQPSLYTSTQPAKAEYGSYSGYFHT